jgi:signal transduction histidine kinase
LLLLSLTQKIPPRAALLCRMVRLLLVLVCCLVLGQSLAQSTAQLRRQVGPLPDTVGKHFWQQLAAHPQPDTLRVVWLTELGDAVQAYNVSAARPVLWAALRLARQLRYRDLVAETLLDLSDYHVQLAQYDSAATYLHESAQAFAKLHDLGGQIRCLGRLGKIADQHGQYAASLLYNFRALALPLTGDTRRFNTSIKIQVGSTYAQVGEYAQARRYLLEALQTSRQYDYPDRLNLVLGALGDVSRQQRQWTTAYRYYREGIAVSRRINDMPTLLATQLDMARLRESQGQYAPAEALGQLVLARAGAANLPLLVPQTQALLARVALRTRHPDLAMAYATQSLRASQRIGLLTGVREASTVLVDAYTQRHAYAQALGALRQFNAVNDSLTGEAIRRRAAVLQFDYERSGQLAQISLLRQQNRLQHQDQELDRLRLQRQLIGLSALTLLLLLLAGGALWQYRRRQAYREASLRTQIAADLHDDVGTLLAQISMQSDLLREGYADATGQRQQLSQISAASRTAVRQLNDVVWSLDAHNDTLPQLLDRFHDYAYEVLTPTGLRVQFESTPAPPARRLPLLLRRNLYLIYKEALVNVLKHAGPATQVTVSLLLEGSYLRLEIANDASLAPAPAAAHQRRSGHGLRNIAARAATLGGAAECGPVAGGGFRVRVRVPLEG